MKIQKQIQIDAIFANKGSFIDENGDKKDYDFTKVIYQEDFPSDNEKAKGKNSVINKIGDSSIFDSVEFKDVKTPFLADCEFEFSVTTGGKAQIKLLSCRPVKKV